MINKQHKSNHTHTHTTETTTNEQTIEMKRITIKLHVSIKSNFRMKRAADQRIIILLSATWQKLLLPPLPLLFAYDTHTHKFHFTKQTQKCLYTNKYIHNVPPSLSVPFSIFVDLAQTSGTHCLSNELNERNKTKKKCKTSIYKNEIRLFLFEMRICCKAERWKIFYFHETL